ncbi:MAG: multidrug ABC transporter ATP-binding protein [Gemmatales bacterium]|nr:MAG: multidrug ABC transporter ATP-binding protein [Gemmatales bacterium]
MPTMIQVDNVTKYFGPILAVDHVSFEVDEGEIVGFLGPNGAGKTTTLRILTSYLPATSGKAKVAGFDVMNHSLEVRRHIGYLPESVPLYPEMRVEEYLSYRAKLKGIERRVRRQRIEYCLERCRIREVRRRLIGTLSKGYRQRVGLADAMVHDPEILILDEPTVGLDPVQIRETLALIKELGTKRTILLSTHILSEVEAICRRVIIIASGRVSFDQPISALEGRTIRLEAKGPAEEIRRVLAEIKEVEEITPVPVGDGVAGFEIQSDGGRDIREEISRRLAEKNVIIRQLTLRPKKLEDVFFQVVRQMNPLESQPTPTTDEESNDVDE